MSATVVTAVLVVVFSIIYWCTRPYRSWKVTQNIPSPPYLPVIGNVHLIPVDAGEFFATFMGWTKTFQEFTLFRALIGPYIWIIMYRAESVEALLNSSKHMTKSRDYYFLHPWLGTGLLTSTGDKWKTRRRMLTPTFHFRILNDFLHVFNEQSSIMVEKLNKMVGCESFNIFPYITTCTLDIICDSAMGKHIHAQEDNDSEYVKAIYKISELIHKRQKGPWLWPDFIYYRIPPGKQFKRCLNILHNFTIKVIQDRQKEFEEQISKEGPTTNPDRPEDDEDVYITIGSRKRLAFLDMLLQMAYKEGNLSTEDIREEVDTFMFEGHDTTAAAGNWAVHLIGRYPDVQEKLHQEMASIFGDSDRPCTMEDINNMSYLNCVIKETLRLFPSVPFFARVISEDCVIGGYDIPKGASSIIVTSALHRDPRYFPDPEKFDPDRFTKENSAGRHPFAYVPFSAGLRNCIGQKFAMNELKVMLAAMLRKFSVQATEKTEDIVQLGEIILRPENGINVKLTKLNGLS